MALTRQHKNIILITVFIRLSMQINRLNPKCNCWEQLRDLMAHLYRELNLASQALSSAYVVYAAPSGINCVVYVSKQRLQSLSLKSLNVARASTAPGMPTCWCTSSRSWSLQKSQNRPLRFQVSFLNKTVGSNNVKPGFLLNLYFYSFSQRTGGSR